MDSLKVSDDAAAAVQKTPNRVSLESMEKKIAAEYTFLASDALQEAPIHESLKILTVCIIVMQNGFTVIGKSAPADAENFNEELGRKFAREDAVRQLWPLEGYALRETLYNGQDREQPEKQAQSPRTAA